MTCAITKALPEFAGAAFEVDLNATPNSFLSPLQSVVFDGFSPQGREEILAAIKIPDDGYQALFWRLEDEACHYRDMRNEFDLYRSRADHKRRLERLREAIALIAVAEEGRADASADFLWELNKRDVQAQIDILALDPFLSPESYLSRMPDFCGTAANKEKYRYPETSFVAALVHIFAVTAGVPITSVEVGRTKSAGKFMAFAWACTSPFRTMFTEETILTAANSLKKGTLEFSILYRSKF